MALEKKKKKKDKEARKAEKKALKASKKEKKEKKSKRTGPTRKEVILNTIREAGKSGIEVSKLVQMIDKKFEYPEGRSSRLRVNNTVKEAVDNGNASRADGIVTWKKG